MLKVDITRHWYRNDLVSFALWPISHVFCAVAKFRRWKLKKEDVLLSQNVPVIIVGNISVGGTGKTPMVIWLTAFLKQNGYKPGIVSRGYGGSHSAPTLVTTDSGVHEVGDEPIIISRQTGVPVFVGTDRVAAANELLARKQVDVIVSDDGMQHYRLPRLLEIAMIDGERRFGNELCLPAGPLREPVSRLKEVDLQVVTGGSSGDDEIPMELHACRLINLRSPGKTKSLDALRGELVHAVAGIGNPERFFTMLENAGIVVERHTFIDHHRYQAEDLHFNDGRLVLMTEKDAVKCGVFAEQNFWYLPINATLPDSAGELILNKLKESKVGQ